MARSSGPTRFLMTMTVVGAACALAIPAAANARPVQPSPSPRYDVIASGLNNPRGLALAENDTLYVAEAGLGAGNSEAGLLEGEGKTGAITRVRDADGKNPRQSVLVSGLWSTASDPGHGLEVTGIDGIAVSNRGNQSTVFGIMSEHADPVGSTNLGYLFSVNASGYRARVRNLADVGGFDFAWTGSHPELAPPGDPQFPDANPYGVLVTNGHTYVVDAGANTLDEVKRDGTVQVLAYLPNTSISDVVPTCVAAGPDGALYIGTLDLAGFFAEGPGQSVVYRVDPRATRPSSLPRVLNVATVWATGFSTITGCTFDRKGYFYAAEMFMDDVQIASFAHPNGARTILTNPLIMQPNGIAVAADGREIYVSTYTSTALAGQGQVVRITR
ncbi:unannotated protein [freshwater metagenome]|uniref:Unannotated protein n=1 Tax=freshwater metagenome TaxID=449393 RepID=A0A6J7IGW6_9ZZZZ|nr:ScyD/ScyE family protein [Actinomycetota bacterium]